MTPFQRRWLAACGVSYASLVLTRFGIGEPLRERLSDLAAEHLPPTASEKAQELIECPYCVSWWVSLVASKGNPLRATQVAGMASVPISWVLIATD